MAKSIYNAAKEVLGVGTDIKNMGIIELPFYLNKNTDIPSMFVEYEFFTSIKAVVKLKDNTFRQKCAIHIKQGLINYYKI